MSDAGDVSSSDFDVGAESAAESVESNIDSPQAESELYSGESEQELYESEYENSEYEDELMDYSYEANNPEAYSNETETPLYNDKGEQVEDVPLYRDNEYLNYDAPDYVNEGKHQVNWPEGDGFEGEPTEMVLTENTIIARYGPETGHSGTAVGTSPTELSLPYDTDTYEYHEYRVCAPINCRSGKASPAFDVDGGGTQWTFSKSFVEMVDDGTLEKIK